MFIIHFQSYAIVPIWHVFLRLSRSHCKHKSGLFCHYLLEWFNVVVIIIAAVVGAVITAGAFVAVVFLLLLYIRPFIFLDKYKTVEVQINANTQAHAHAQAINKHTK